MFSDAEEGQPHMQHDDVIGEEVSEAEAQAVRVQIMCGILGPEALDSELRFPGSQPVSLAALNMDLLAKHRYFVTWKADGTRYMLYLSPMGTYLVDRSFSVRRVQMRWPTAAPHSPHQYDPTKPHQSTLLDGEMVVDEDKATKAQKRRYLAYDLMMLNGQLLRRRDFKVSQMARSCDPAGWTAPFCKVAAIQFIVAHPSQTIHASFTACQYGSWVIAWTQQ